MEPVGYHAAQTLAEKELARSTARLLHQLGFTHSSESALDMVSDLARRHLQKTCETLRWVSEHCGRTNVSLGDVEFVYRRMDVDVDEMNLYMKQVRPLPANRLLPRFPVSRPSCPTIRSRPVDLPSLRPPHIPPWAPPLCSVWLKEAPQPPVKHPRNPKSICSSSNGLALPDFANQTSRSLGLTKGRKQPLAYLHQPFRGKYSAPPSRPSSSLSISRPPSRPSSRCDALREFAAEIMPIVRPPSSASVGSTNGIGYSSGGGGGTVQQPMFKRRLGKRRSNEELVQSATPTPPASSQQSPAVPLPPAIPFVPAGGAHSTPVPTSIIPSVVSSTSLSRLREQHTSIDDLLKAGAASTSDIIHPSVDRAPGPARQERTSTPRRASNSLVPAASAPLLTLASDLATDARKVVSAALSGKSAPVAVPLPLASPLRAVPLHSGNLEEEPRDDEQPMRVVQMAILRHMFTLDADKDALISQAFEHISGQRRPEPSAAPEDTSAVPSTPKPEYRIVSMASQSEMAAADLCVMPPLKIKISRSSLGGATSCDPSPAASIATTASQSSDDEVIPEKRKKHKKKKKKKHRREHEMREEDDRLASAVSTGYLSPSTSGQPSPCELQPGGGIRLKIRLGRRASSTASSANATAASTPHP